MIRSRSGLQGATIALLAVFVPAQNSGRKVRPAPSEVAARAGMGVEWRADLASALAESERTSRPVFWYVPTLRGSPMDRKPEIDRYMMAGPFSNPDVIALLNSNFVPVREAGDQAAARDFGLQPREFIEPGFLVLDQGSEVLARVDRVSTLHPAWLLAQLHPHAGSEVPARSLPVALASAWRDYAEGRFDAARERLEAAPRADWGPQWQAEAGFLVGALEHRSGRADAGLIEWRRVAADYPDEPYGWKAAAEAEGHGPFARGFEDFVAVKPDALVGGASTTRAPHGVYSEAELRQLGMRFLLAMQQPSGHYTDSWYDFGGTDGLPNVHMAVTAIVGEALLEELSRPEGSEVVAAELALDAILAAVGDDSMINVADRDELVWAHAYRIFFLARWVEQRPADRDRILPLLQRVVVDVQGMATRSGAWFHEYENPFVTATVLVALHDAQSVGAAVDEERVDDGIKALLRCRVKTGAFSYGQPRKVPRSSVAAAAGRMPLCELALALWRGDNPEALPRALVAAFEHHEQLEGVRKYDDHANTLGYGGFFYWYDMHGRTLAIRALEDRELRRDLAQRQRELILAIPEFDGCFVDSHELGRVYGTASALLCLSILRTIE